MLFLVSGVVGGIGWMIVNWMEPSFWLNAHRLPGAFWPVLAQRWAEQQPIGAFGVCIGAFAALCPKRELLLLVFFVIPVRMKARTLALLLMVVTVVQLVAGWGQVAYAAHLIGGVAGCLLALNWRRRVLVPASVVMQPVLEFPFQRAYGIPFQSGDHHGKIHIQKCRLGSLPGFRSPVARTVAQTRRFDL